MKPKLLLTSEFLKDTTLKVYYCPGDEQPYKVILLDYDLVEPHPPIISEFKTFGAAALRTSRLIRDRLEDLNLLPEEETQADEIQPGD